MPMCRFHVKLRMWSGRGTALDVAAHPAMVAVLASGHFGSCAGMDPVGGGKVVREHSEQTIAIEAPDRRALIERFCLALGDALAAGEDTAAGTLVPWQVSAATFEDLPAEILATVTAILEEEGQALASIEPGGYLETDDGSRAWGTVALRDGDADPGKATEVIDLRFGTTADGLTLEVILRGAAAGGGSHDD